jgi:hypothetical protein
MLSKLKLISAEVEAKETEVEVKEAEVMIMQWIIQKKDPHKNTQDNHNNLKTHRIKEKEVESGQTNLGFDVNIAKSMVTMRMNAERRIERKCLQQ